MEERFAVSAARRYAGLQQLPCTHKHRHRAEIHTGAYAAALADGPEVAQQPESRDVGAGVGAGSGHSLRGGPVERGHLADRVGQDVVWHTLLLAGGGDDTGANRLGQHQHVARAGARVGHFRARRNEAGYGEAVLGLLVVHCVASHYQHAGFLGLSAAAPQDFT